MKLALVFQLFLATVLGGPFAQVPPPAGQGGQVQSPAQTASPLPPGASQPSGIQMSARAGLDGVARVGTWVPLEVELTNDGDDIQGQIDVRVEDARRQGVYGRAPTVYTLPVDLPHKSHKRLTMEVLFPSTSNRLQVTLDSAGQQILQQDVSMSRVALGDFLCGIVSRDPQVFDFLPSLELAGPQRRVRLAHVQEAQIPDRAQLLSSLDCLILANAQTVALRPAQIEALRVWVAAGGLLIGVGGPTWQKTLSPLPDELLAVRPTDLATLDTLHGLVDVAGAAPGQGPWLVSRGRADGSVVAQQDGIPLLVGRKQGQGTVFYLAFDPTAPKLTAWRGQTYLWRYILSHASVDTGVGSTLARPYMRWGRLPRAALSDFESLPKPDFSWVTWGLLGYAIAVGPLSFLLVRRSGRPMLALATVPLLATAATVAFMSVAVVDRESDLAATKATVIRSVGGELAYSRSYVSIFARGAGLYDIQVPDGALVFGLYYPFPMRSYTDTPHWALNVTEGSQTQVDDLDLSDGALATFAIDQQVKLGGTLDAKLVAHDDQVVGTVTNRFDESIRGAALLLDMQTVYPLGDLAPGESRSVALDLPEQAAIGYGVPTGLPSQIYPGWTSARPQDSSRRDLLESIFSSRYYAARMDVAGLTLVGWLERTPLEMGASGKQLDSVDNALLVAPVAVGLEEGYEGPLRPSLMMRQHLTVAPVGQQDFGSYTLAAGESISLQFTLPVRPDRLEIQDLALRLEGQPTGPTGADMASLGHLSFFDWRTATWRDWEAHFGETHLTAPDRFVSAGGDVRVKYTFDPPESAKLTAVRLSRFDLTGQVRVL